MIKEYMKIVVGVLIALLVWELVIKKFVLKSEFEEGFDDQQE